MRRDSYLRPDRGLTGFEGLELAHRDLIGKYLSSDPPLVSEMTFTNLFMWREQYFPCWKEYAGCLLLALWDRETRSYFGLAPVGEGDKPRALDHLIDNLVDCCGKGLVSRVATGFVKDYLDTSRYQAILNRDHADYVYLTEDLIQLKGRKFHKKKNLLNKFQRSFNHEYLPLDDGLVREVLGMQRSWCNLRHCELDNGLSHENMGIVDLLTHFSELDYKGGVILVDGRVEAFALGERLNPETAVIHVEKANPEMTGLYAAMNQYFAARAWSGLLYINREQDLGLDSLRQAKMSYNPHYLVEKYDITPR